MRWGNVFIAVNHSIPRHQWREKLEQMVDTFAYATFSDKELTRYHKNNFADKRKLYLDILMENYAKLAKEENKDK